MKDQHILSTLIAKRRELTGKIEQMQSEVKQAVIELDHVEATIRIFNPEIDFEAITPRRIPTAHHALRGEVTRVVLETLRKSGRPMDTRALTDAVMKERGLDVNDARLHRLMQQRVGACLNHWKRVKKVIKSMPGAAGLLIWEIVDQPSLSAPPGRSLAPKAV